VQLVENGVREDADLDFKRDRYGQSDQAKREFAADVAAMANDRGGLIIIGVRDDNDIAVELTPVELDAGEEARLRLTAAGNVAPHAPFEVQVVPSEGRPDRGYYLLVIPPSPLRPHAVRKDNDLRYPRRDGTTKRWLSEAEVADMYRDRFRGSADQVERVGVALEEGLAAMDTSEEAFVALAIVPASSGSMSSSLTQVRAVQDWATQFGPVDWWRGFFPSSPYAGVGPRRFTVATIYDRTTQPNWAYLELHFDGTGFACQRLSDPRRAGELPGTWVLNETLLFATARCLRVLGRHAVENAGAFGDCLVEARIVGTEMQLAYLHYLGGAYFPELIENPRTINGAVSRHTVTLGTLAGGGQELLAAARLVVTDLFNAFGAPEVRHVTEDGTLRLAYFGVFREEAARLAGDDGIEVTDEPVAGEP
jgi:Putative DNA-binding domain